MPVSTLRGWLGMSVGAISSFCGARWVLISSDTHNTGVLKLVYKSQLLKFQGLVSWLLNTAIIKN